MTQEAAADEPRAGDDALDAMWCSTNKLHDLSGKCCMGCMDSMWLTLNSPIEKSPTPPAHPAPLNPSIPAPPALVPPPPLHLHSPCPCDPTTPEVPIGQLLWDVKVLIHSCMQTWCPCASASPLRPSSGSLWSASPGLDRSRAKDSLDALLRPNQEGNMMSGLSAQTVCQCTFLTKATEK